MTLPYYILFRANENGGMLTKIAMEKSLLRKELTSAGWPDFLQTTGGIQACRDAVDLAHFVVLL